MDAWSRMSGANDRTLHVSGAIEQRLANDHVALRLSAGRWAGIGRAPAFGTAAFDASARNRRSPGPLVLMASAGVNTVSSNAPLAVWSGAGEGRSRTPLLRAHSLLRDGRIDGPVFGRRLAHATVEAQHWLEKPGFVRIGGVAFLDAAAAGRRPAFSRGLSMQVDAGLGLRVQVPGRSGFFRVDYARGVRDGSHAWIVGWQRE
jgi:hypothetical protein